MSVFRQKYYDCFSSFYDRFIAIHSSDKGENARVFLSGHTALSRGDCALDICTGTGSLLPHLGNKVKNEGIVVGIDFSFGMLSVARSKIGKRSTIFCLRI